MKIKPLNNNILVSLQEREVKRKSGLYVPTDEKLNYQIAKVIHAGNSDMVEKGDDILIEDFAATTIKVGDEDQFFVKEEDILAVYD